MLSMVEEGGFYRTHDGGVAYVFVERDADGDAGFLLLRAGSRKWPLGDIHFLQPDGSIYGEENETSHPLLLIERLDLELPACRKWISLEFDGGTEYPAARARWTEILADMQLLLDAHAGHEPPQARAGGFYRTLNHSIAYVLEVEDGYAHVALLKGGAGGQRPGYVFRMAVDGATGGDNPLEFALVFKERLDLVLP